MCHVLPSRMLVENGSGRCTVWILSSESYHFLFSLGLVRVYLEALKMKKETWNVKKKIKIKLN